MLDPITLSLNVQKASVEATSSATQLLLRNYMKMIDQQNRLIHTALGRRSEDSKKAKHYKHSGPTLTDHYGNRCHDVDVERI